MRKKAIIISGIIIISTGILLLLALFYLEKQDLKEEKAIPQTAETQYQKTKQKEQKSEVLTEEAAKTQLPIETQTEESVAVVFAGDVYLSSYVTGNYDTEGISGVLDETLLETMQGADILMVNQEFPFGTGGTPAEDKQFTFRVEPSYVTLLQDMGVDVVSLANNHVLDYGQEVLSENLKILQENQILYAGAGETKEEAFALRIIEVRGRKYGFLSASRVIPVASWNIENAQPGVSATYDKTALVSAIENAQTVCDFLTVYVHWGIERNTTPEQYQRELAHAYMDAGADLVIGAHPHVLQGIEAYNGKLIFYSLGNYIFNRSIEKTMLVKVSQQGEETTISILPAYAQSAKTKEYEDKEEFYDYMESLSLGIAIDNGEVRLLTDE